MTAAVEIHDLSLRFGVGKGAVQALDGIDLRIEQGTILGIVGESGSGKSTLGFALGNLLPEGTTPQAGRLHLLGRDVYSMTRQQLRALRKTELRYVLQDPIASLDPTRRVGQQIAEAVSPQADQVAVLQALREVGLKDAERVARAWPHELSGGMAQRVAIAIATIARPRILVADEATSALDASVRTRILDLLRGKTRELGSTLLLLSHDLWAVRKYCDEVAVMYGGRIVEHGPVEAVFSTPAHPYTRALLAATPGRERLGEALATVPGSARMLNAPATGCAFALRCGQASSKCQTMRPPNDPNGIKRRVLCHHWLDVNEGAT